MPIPAILATVAGSVIGGLVQKMFGGDASSAPAPTPAPNTLGKDDFLRLLTTQLQNQDPMNPVSNTDFIAQTAQFTSLEELQNIQKSLNSFLSKVGGGGGGAGGVAGAAPLLGRTVTVNGSSLTFDGAHPVGLGYQLPVAAPSVFVQITDGSGTVVRTMAMGQQGGGIHQIPFDGRNDAGQLLPPGQYSYRVGAADTKGNVVAGILTGGGQVTGISVENGQLVLLVGQDRVPLASVVGVTAGTIY